jgi:hypothetical protein
MIAQYHSCQNAKEIRQLAENRTFWHFLDASQSRILHHLTVFCRQVCRIPGGEGGFGAYPAAERALDSVGKKFLVGGVFLLASVKCGAIMMFTHAHPNQQSFVGERG